MKAKVLSVIALALTLTFAAQPAIAGCGCDKAPPDAATVRPNATFSGTDVYIFDDDLQPGATYRVDFVSGTTNAVSTVNAVAIAQIDLADADRKVEDREPVPQLVLTLPDMPLGPTAVVVTKQGQAAPLSPSTMKR